MRGRYFFTAVCALGLLGCDGSSVIGGASDSGTDLGTVVDVVDVLDVTETAVDASDDVVDATDAVDLGPPVRCAPSERNCGGQCFDIGSDRRHCGGCNAACTAGQGCVAGLCQTGCGQGQTLCGEVCTDTRFDPEHCGACSTRCPSNQLCNRGTCTLTCADAGTGISECSPVEGVRYCADTQNDRRNCGACNTLCAVGQVCLEGQCQTACPPGQIRCSGTCVDPQNDRNHCGACANRCPTGQVCAGALCTLECTTGLTRCGAGDAQRCADLQSDNTHCGACDTACPQGQRCTAGRCTLECPPGQTVCDATCRDLQTDNAHCGACGTACPSGQSCTAGRCAITCSMSQQACDNACRDLQTDLAHCGACSNACPRRDNASATCTAGQCTSACNAGYADCDTMLANGCETALLSTVAHCGRCGNACTAANGTPACQNGTCTIGACATGFGDCNALVADGCETNTNTALTHCGRCGNACNLANATATCTAGACAIAQCAPGFADCDGNAANGCEVSTQSDNTRCGSCTTQCTTGQICAMGTCTLSCPTGQTVCGLGCFDTSVALLHCGACNQACPSRANATTSCTAGRCGFTCFAGFADCDGVPDNGCEVDTRTDLTHCGACNRACTVANGTAACVAGTCTVARCNTGRGDCNGMAADGCEVDTTTTLAHCGACGAMCSLPGATAQCTASQCTLMACQTSTCNLDGNAANGCEGSRRSDSFDGTSLGSQWVQTVGEAPTYTVSGGELVITNAPWASTPSTSSHSWVYDYEVDRANQRAWAQAIGTGPFELTYDFRWDSNVPELTYAGIALINGANQIEVFAGPYDGYAAALGGVAVNVRVPGSAPDLGWFSGYQGSGSGQFVYRRIGRTLTVSLNGQTVVTDTNNTADIRAIAIVALRHRNPNDYPFGTFVVTDLRFCY